MRAFQEMLLDETLLSTGLMELPDVWMTFNGDKVSHPVRDTFAAYSIFQCDCMISLMADAVSSLIYINAVAIYPVLAGSNVL